MTARGPFWNSFATSTQKIYRNEDYWQGVKFQLTNTSQHVVTGLGDGNEGYVVHDRISHTVVAGAGRFTVTPASITDLPGFANALQVTCTTADTSIGSADLICPLWYIVEKRDVDARLAYGTSSAKPITMSFWIKSNVTGTYTISAYRSATPARVQAQTYTISSANTWEFKTLTFLFLLVPLLCMYNI